MVVWLAFDVDGDLFLHERKRHYVSFDDYELE